MPKKGNLVAPKVNCMEGNRIGSFYDVTGTDGHDGQWLSRQEVVSVDTSKMTASAIITTPSFDRERDALNPRGASLKNYSLNPIVLWNHGFDCSLPIGRSSDDDNNLTLEVSDAGIIATCHFSKSLPLANQIFGLIDEDIVRATSVRFTPLERPKQKAHGLLHGSYDLEEWSWVPIGVNPKAVRPVLSSGKLNGEQLMPTLTKSLKAFVPPHKRRTFQGHTFEMKTKSRQPLGARALQSAHLNIGELGAKVKGMMAEVENPGASATLETISAKLDEILTQLEGGYAETYPEESEFKGYQECDCAGEDGCDCDDKEREQMKSYLAHNPSKRLALSAAAGRMKSLTTPEAKHAVEMITGLVQEAREFTPEPAVDETKFKSLLEQVDSVITQNKTLRKQLAEVIPARKV